MIRGAGLLLLCFLLAFPAGCAVLGPGPAMTSVILPTRLPGPSQAGRLSASLLVTRPTADGATGTDRIMALMNGYELRALDSAKWADSTPAIVQRQLVDALESTRRFAGVSWEESAPDRTYRLSTEIRRFFLRYDSGNAAPVAEIAMAISLTVPETGAVVARRFLRIERPCRENTLDAFVAAFSEAMTETLAQTAQWAEETLEEAERRSAKGGKKDPNR